MPLRRLGRVEAGGTKVVDRVGSETGLFTEDGSRVGMNGPGKTNDAKRRAGQTGLVGIRIPFFEGWGGGSHLFEDSALGVCVVRQIVPIIRLYLMVYDMCANLCNSHPDPEHLFFLLCLYTGSDFREKLYSDEVLLRGLDDG